MTCPWSCFNCPYICVSLYIYLQEQRLFQVKLNGQRSGEPSLIDNPTSLAWSSHNHKDKYRPRKDDRATVLSRDSDHFTADSAPTAGEAVSADSRVDDIDSCLAINTKLTTPPLPPMSPPITAAPAVGREEGGEDSDGDDGGDAVSNSLLNYYGGSGSALGPSKSVPPVVDSAARSDTGSVRGDAARDISETRSVDTHNSDTVSVSQRSDADRNTRAQKAPSSSSSSGRKSLSVFASFMSHATTLPSGLVSHVQPSSTHPEPISAHSPTPSNTSRQSEALTSDPSPAQGHTQGRLFSFAKSVSAAVTSFPSLPLSASTDLVAPSTYTSIAKQMTQGLTQLIQFDNVFQFDELDELVRATLWMPPTCR